MEIKNFENSVFLEGFGLSGAAARTGNYYKKIERNIRKIYILGVFEKTQKKMRETEDKRSMVPLDRRYVT